MEDEHQHYIGKVAHKALIEKNGKILLAKGAGDQFWDIPGGRIHSNEKPKQALMREIKEELGLDISVGKPFFADLIRATKTGEERYFIAFKAELVDVHQPLSLDPTEAAEIIWLDKKDIETVETYEVCRDALRAYIT
jgi:8-oxo-dGTP pyrophosphatase MutT (NUDIX family)